jgi:pyruvate/2-oxoacid:ferredoxin oxidoreductase alpha subunit
VLNDFGWNCIVSENVQETYDATILSVMIAEDSLFPTMFVHDGFITSHSSQRITLIPDEIVRKLTPKKPRQHITTKRPGTWGGIVSPSYYMEGRLGLDVDKKHALNRTTNAFKRFNKATGWKYKLIDTYNLDNPSKTAFITMGSMCGNIVSWMTQNRDI